MPAQNPRAASGPRTQRKRPGDLTGVNSQKLAAAAAKEREEEDRAAVAAEAEERETKRRTVVNYAEPSNDVETEDELEVDEAVEVRPKTERIRVNYPIDDMTFGREVINPGDFDEENMRWRKPPVLGNLRVYSFQEGPTYEVTADMADHLRSLGYVYEY